MSWRDRLKRLRGGPDWPAWAADRDFTFAEESPELIGVWLPVFDGSSERYVNVVGGRWRTLEFQAFTHGTYRRPHGGVQSFSTSNGYLVLQLPGGLPPEIAAMSPDDAFKLLGGRIPSSFDFTPPAEAPLRRDGGQLEPRTARRRPREPHPADRGCAARALAEN